jgi:hypothetical protein
LPAGNLKVLLLDSRRPLTNGKGPSGSKIRKSGTTDSLQIVLVTPRSLMNQVYHTISEDGNKTREFTKKFPSNLIGDTSRMWEGKKIAPQLFC